MPASAAVVGVFEFGPAVDAVDGPLGATVEHVVEQPAIAARRIGRPQDCEIDIVGDAAARVPRSPVEQANAAVARMLRIDAAESGPAHPLIGPDLAEAASIEGRRRRFEPQAIDAGDGSIGHGRAYAGEVDGRCRTI